MQKARAEQREELFAKQSIQRRLLKLKLKLHEFKKYEESPVPQRKQVTIVAELDQFLKLISREAKGEIFERKAMKRSKKN
jgi:hypothetical protein